MSTAGLGSACIEASCCGVGSWAYIRAQGYLTGNQLPTGWSEGRFADIDTIERAGEKAAITKLLPAKHPGSKVEFRQSWSLLRARRGFGCE